jgi:hypothetical protein
LLVNPAPFSIPKKGVNMSFDLPTTATERYREEHIYHHSDNDGVRISIKVEKNTKGFNYEASISGAKNVDEAFAALRDAQYRLEKEYGAQV